MEVEAASWLRRMRQGAPGVVCSPGSSPSRSQRRIVNNRRQPHLPRRPRCLRLHGHPSFLYVADCKLATRDQMGHIEERGGRFVTVLPRSRSEDARLRQWMSTSAQPEWTEAERRDGKRKGETFDPELSELQCQLLDLLGVPTSGYTNNSVR